MLLALLVPPTRAEEFTGEAYRIELTRIAEDRLAFVVESARTRIADGKLDIQEGA